MATHTWISTSSQDWNTAGNWDGGVPISNGIAVIKSGTVAPTANLNQTAVDLDLLYVEPGAPAVGASGNPLIISADKVIRRGSNEFHYQDGGGTTDFMVIDADTPAAINAVSAATVTDLYILRGTVTCSGTVTNLYIQYHDNPSSDALVTVSAAATLSTLVTITGGISTISTTIPLLHMSGGTLTQNTATITTGHQYGGEVVYNGYAAGGVTIAAWFGKGGRLDFTKSGGTKTITRLDESPGFEWLNCGDRTVHIVTTHNYLKSISRA